MPNRIVREGILDSKAVAALSDSGEIFYRRLMSIVDDFGRYEADPELLRVKCFPRQLDRWTVERVATALAEVGRTPADGGFPLVLIYKSGNREYLEISNFEQRLRSKTKKYPDPTARQAVDARAVVSQTDDGHVADTCQTDGGHMADTRGQLGVVPFSSLPYVFSSSKKEEKSKSFPMSARFDEFWGKHPGKKLRKDPAAGVWAHEVTTENEAAVFACLDRYLASQEVANRAYMNPENWLSECAAGKFEATWPVAKARDSPAGRFGGNSSGGPETNDGYQVFS